MRVRRLTQHLEAQNWLAVGLDLAIVVVGIFLGLQVSAWNESRQDRLREADILDRLKTAFEEIQSEVDKALDFHRNVIGALNTILLSLETGEVQHEDEDSFRYGLQTAMWYDTGAGRSGTYVDLVSGGQVRLIRNDQLRSLLSEYDEFYEKANVLFSQFWEGQRNHEIAFGQHFSYDPLRQRNGEFFLPGEIAEFDISGMAADREFQQALHRLIEYQVYYQVWHSNMGNAASEVLSLLEAT